MADDPGGRFSRAIVVLPLLVACVVALCVMSSRGLLLATLATLATGGISAAVFAAFVGIHLLISQEPAARRALHALAWLAAAAGLSLAVEIVSWIR